MGGLVNTLPSARRKRPAQVYRAMDGDCRRAAEAIGRRKGDPPKYVRDQHVHLSLRVVQDEERLLGRLEVRYYGK